MTFKSPVGNGIKKLIHANILTGTLGRAVAQATSRWLPTAAARVACGR
jgi:hypothetical protein